MDTWSVAQMMLDVIFAVTVVGVVIGLLYFREKRIYTRISEILTHTSEPAVAPLAPTEEAPQPALPQVIESSPVRARNSRAGSAPRAPRTARKSNLVNATRAEKYLEAVRMYRQGSDKGTIEKALGISFMELELLGRIK